jgi:2-keto-3-deoxy-L-rhamnonate aldolase RhmA
VALGTAIFSNNPAIVEVAGYSGLDFIRIDNEYSWRRDESMNYADFAGGQGRSLPYQ